jgi:putative CocE/NonD family hydrolase
MKKIFRTLFTVALVFSLVGLWTGITPAQQKISKPGVYSGYSAVLYTQWVRNSQYVAVKDGTKLAVDIFRPAVNGKAVDTPYPVVFQQTQYRRAYYSGSTMIATGASMANALTKYGYVVAVADPRGLGASYGTRRASWGMEEARDAHDIIEWLAVQPWSNGNVGMWGLSYMGGIQLLAASTMPPHLKAIFPAQAPFDQYDELFTIIPPRGGFGELGSLASDMLTASVDGDADNNGDGYPDMLYEAVQQHKPHYDTIKAYAESLGQVGGVYSQVGPTPYRDSIGPLVNSRFFYESSASSYIDEIRRSGVGIYNMGYWNNWLRRGSISAFANLENPSKLIMTESSNMPSFSFDTEHLRFFDYWLKGIDNGIMDEPPIYYNVLKAPTGNNWRFAWKWPLPNEKPTNYYLHAGPSGSNPGSVNDGTLSLTAPTAVDAKDDYAVFYGITSANMDAKGLTYTTGSLTADVEIIGHPVVQLWISSDHTDGDFVASLEEVDATGKSTVVANGKVRASLRKIADPPYSYMGLPWRRALQTDEQKLTSGKPVELLFDLLPVSYVFKKGNRIRLNIVCDSPPDTPVLSPTPVVSVYRNAVLSSFISLPITTEPITAKVQIVPGILSLRSHGKFTAFITLPKNLPKGYQIEDIDISTLKCHGASAVSGRLIHDILIAKFDIGDLTDVSAGREVTFTVTGEFNYGIPFEGSDTIRVIGK